MTRRCAGSLNQLDTSVRTNGFNLFDMDTDRRHDILSTLSKTSSTLRSSSRLVVARVVSLVKLLS